MGAIGGGEIHTATVSTATGCRIAAMGRGLAAVALLAALTIPTAAQAKQAELLPWPNDR